MLRLAIIAGFFALASTALAQFSQSGGQTYGAFGNRAVGQGTRSGTSGFSTGNTSSMGSSGMSSGGAGNNSQLGGPPAGNFRLGSSITDPNQLRNSTSQLRSSAGFVGGDASEGAANVRSMQGMQGAQGMQGLNSLFGAQGAFSQFARQNQMQNQNRNQNQNQNGKKQLRISIQADIPRSTGAYSSTSLGRQFEARLRKLPGLENRHDVAVTMEGRTAVLQGTVTSDRDREVIAGLALLEPGISAVRNELTVSEPAATEELPPPSR